MEPPHIKLGWVHPRGGGGKFNARGKASIHLNRVTRKLKLLTLISEFLVSFMELQFHMGGMISSLAEGILCLEQDLFDQNGECSSAVMIQTWKEERILSKKSTVWCSSAGTEAYIAINVPRTKRFFLGLGFM